jgi:hypothetical protein
VPQITCKWSPSVLSITSSRTDGRRRPRARGR